MKDVIEFEIDGAIVLVEADQDSKGRITGTFQAGSGGASPKSTPQKFEQAIAHIQPAAEKVLEIFQQMKAPDEIAMEFGVKFNAKAGMAMLASVDSEATFKVSLKWKKPSENKQDG